MSSRMKSQKLLLNLGGKKIVEHVISVASRFSWSKVTAVIGEPREEMERLFSRYDFSCIYNEKPQRGQSSSVRLGLSEMPCNLDGYLFLLGDQPLIKYDLIDRMLKIFDLAEDNKKIVVPYCKDEPRSPILFGTGWFFELMSTKGDKGGRQIGRNNPGNVIALQWDDPAYFLDVDTMDDYNMVCEKYNTIND